MTKIDQKPFRIKKKLIILTNHPNFFFYSKGFLSILVIFSHFFNLYEGGGTRRGHWVANYGAWGLPLTIRQL